MDQYDKKNRLMNSKKKKKDNKEVNEEEIAAADVLSVFDAHVHHNSDIEEIKRSIHSLQSQMEEIRVTVGNIHNRMEVVDHKLILETMLEMKREITELKNERISGNAMKVAVQSWLRAIGFERYHKMFMKNGLDTMRAVQVLSREQFDVLRFDKSQDKSSVWIAIQSLKGLQQSGL